MLAKEGKEKEAMVQACNKVALDAADAKEQCEDKSKYSNDGGQTACKFTAKIMGKCMKNGQEVQGKTKETCDDDTDESWEGEGRSKMRINILMANYYFIYN